MSVRMAVTRVVLVFVAVLMVMVSWPWSSWS